jgi:hypothetical protein
MAPTVVSDERGVAVRVAGVLTPEAAICPTSELDCGSGIRVEGVLGDAAAGDNVTGLGWYDGARLLLAAPLERVEAPPSAMTADYDSLCPELSNPVGVDQTAAMDRAVAILGFHGPDDGSDSLAEAWIDRERNVMTLWFARDLDVHRDALLEAFGDINVCLADGARFSQRELFDAARQISELQQQGLFVVQGGFSIDGRANRVVVPIESLDATGRAALDQIAAVVAVPYVELLDQPVDALPGWQPAVTGTVDLITAASRSTAGMDALGSFTIQYDADGNCLYWEQDGRRGTLAWPFGFSATEADGVATVFDASGAEVVTTGEAVELGGGGGSLETWVPGTTFVGDNLCGATELWVVNA